MWLPKDERTLLCRYYKHLENTQNYRRFTNLSQRAYIATRDLITRGLLKEIEEGGPDHTEALTAFLCEDPIDLADVLPSEDQTNQDDITLKLTLVGRDLALKYTNPFLKIALLLGRYEALRNILAWFRVLA